jgi:hypothetical protein
VEKKEEEVAATNLSIDGLLRPAYARWTLLPSKWKEDHAPFDSVGFVVFVDCRAEKLPLGFESRWRRHEHSVGGDGARHRLLASAGSLQEAEPPRAVVIVACI